MNTLALFRRRRLESMRIQLAGARGELAGMKAIEQIYGGTYPRRLLRLSREIGELEYRISEAVKKVT